MPAPKEDKGKGLHYWRREGEPGHYTYLYRDPELGNIMSATNAPLDHPHHEEYLGEPKLIEGQPNPKENPEFFNPQNGRKLNRKVPEGAEWNSGYDPDKPLFMWAARWRLAGDPSGEVQFAYYDDDLRTRDELRFNVSNRHVDEQMPKLRGLYRSLLDDKQPSNRAMGLMMALMDQAKSPDELFDSKVGDVIVRGNGAVFSYRDKKTHQVIAFDQKALDGLSELLEGKDKSDPVFAVPAGEGLRTVGHNRIASNLESIGMTPEELRVYQGSMTFSKAFGYKVSKIKGRPEVKQLEQLTKETAVEVGKALGVLDDPQSILERYVDPCVVKSLYLNSINPESMDKAQRLQGRTEFQGLAVSIENRKGSVRKWYNPHDKTEGETKMHFPYGYIRRTEGADGDHVDVYLGPNKDAPTAFVVHQMKAPDFTKYDEDKVMLGFDSAEEAKAAYIKQYDNPKFFGKMTAVPMEEFKEKVLNKENHGQMVKSAVGEVEVDNEFPIHSVSAEPPAQYPEEEEFSYWLHFNPIHEVEYEFQNVKHMGFKDLYKPVVNYQYADDPKVLEEG